MATEINDAGFGIPGVDRLRLAGKLLDSLQIADGLSLPSHVQQFANVGIEHASHLGQSGGTDRRQADAAVALGNLNQLDEIGLVVVAGRGLDIPE